MRGNLERERKKNMKTAKENVKGNSGEKNVGMRIRGCEKELERGSLGKARQRERCNTETLLQHRTSLQHRTLLRKGSCQRIVRHRDAATKNVAADKQMVAADGASE